MRRFLRGVQRLFLVAGVTALGWCAYVLTDAYFAQRFARETLASVASAPRAGRADTPVKPRQEVAIGTPLAELSIPRVGLSTVVLHGTDTHTLRLGLGHIENTAFPGESGNVAIAGHRDSFFRPLQRVRVGDEIVLNTPEERVLYRVTFTRVVNSTDVDVISPTREPTLTLVTCYPFWFIGEAPDRFVVRATRVENSTAPAGVSSDDRVSSDDGVRESVKTAVPARDTVTSQRDASAAFAGGIHDDVRAVREAVERFRLTYNARASRHPESAADALLALGSCEVSVEPESATALCKATTSTEPSSATPWTFTLVRNGNGWTIRTIAMN